MSGRLKASPQACVCTLMSAFVLESFVLACLGGGSLGAALMSVCLETAGGRYIGVPVNI